MDVAITHTHTTLRLILAPPSTDNPLQLGKPPRGGTASPTVFPSLDLKKFDPVRFSEIAPVLLLRSIVPMFEYAQAAASDAVAFRIV